MLAQVRLCKFHDESDLSAPPAANGSALLQAHRTTSRAFRRSPNVDPAVHPTYSDVLTQRAAREFHDPDAPPHGGPMAVASGEVRPEPATCCACGKGDSASAIAVLAHQPCALKSYTKVLYN